MNDQWTSTAMGMREQPRDDARVLNQTDIKELALSTHPLYGTPRHGSTHIDMNVSQIVYESWDQRGAARKKCVCLPTAWSIGWYRMNLTSMATSKRNTHCSGRMALYIFGYLENSGHSLQVLVISGNFRRSLAPVSIGYAWRSAL